MSHHRDLTPADLEVLEFARASWRYVGARDNAILERFGHLATRYFQRLDALLDHPQAAAYNPTHVRQLLQLRQARVNQRSEAHRGVGTTNRKATR